MTDRWFSSIQDRPDIFPNQWFGEKINMDEVAWVCGDINPSSKLVSKSRLNSEIWNKTALGDLISSYAEKWNFQGELIICVWDEKMQEIDKPIGFVSFSFRWDETKTRKLSSLSIDLDLLWVRPDKRGLGGVAAKHVITHMIHYLDSCKFSHPHVSLRGMDILYQADFDSAGGEHASSIIEENLEFFKSSGQWKVRTLDIDVGY